MQSISRNRVERAACELRGRTHSSGFVDQIFCQCARGNAVKARTSVLAASISGPNFGNDLVSWSRTSSQVSLTASA